MKNIPQGNWDEL